MEYTLISIDKKDINLIRISRILYTLFVLLIIFLIPFKILANENSRIKVSKGGIRYIVPPDKIVSAGVAKDGIPSIDRPEFVSVKNADKWLQDDDLVIVLVHKNIVRVYPLQILLWHEIVNDNVAGDPILVTYDPLCGSALAFVRCINRKQVEFGTSGKLYNSNLVMYDRNTNTLWSQVEGLAIFGKLAGTKLKSVSIDIVEWGNFKKEHPNSMVLSKKTGYSYPYGKDPYKNYYNKSFIMFPVDHVDSSIFSKTLIYGIEVNGEYKAYMEKDIINKSIIYDTINGMKIKAKRYKNSRVKFTVIKTGREIVKKRMFWFTWYTFHPETELYGRD